MIMPLSPGGPHAELERFVFGLLSIADWETDNGLIEFNDQLALSELANAPFFLNARCLLRLLDAIGGTAATAAGNLNRPFVHRMLDLLCLAPPYRQALRRAKALNEQNVFPLHLVRVVCECGNLLALRRRRFMVTRRGRELLADERAGTLYRHLFLAHFRHFNLGYRFPFREVPGIQTTMAVILWRLWHVARDWTPVRGLAEPVLLPPVYEELRAARQSPHDTEAWILSGYVLEPLWDFGLIETQVPGDWAAVTEDDQIRVSPLFGRFIRFPSEP